MAEKKKETFKFGKMEMGFLLVGLVLGIVIFALLVPPKIIKEEQNATLQNITPKMTSGKVYSIFENKMRVYYGIDTDWTSISTPKFNEKIMLWSVNMSYIDPSNITRAINAYISDEGKIELISMLLPSQDKPENVQILKKSECNSTNQPYVLEFTDPYCPISIILENLTRKTAEKYNATLEHRFVYTASDGLKKQYGEEEIRMAFKYYECHELNGKYYEFRDCFIATYSKNNRPLTESELKECSALDNTTLSECLKTADAKLSEDAAFAESYLSQIATPTYILNCKYLSSRPKYLDNSICFAYNYTSCWKIR